MNRLVPIVRSPSWFMPPFARTGAAEGRGRPRSAPSAEATKVSDLDRPTEELFAANCEHARKTHECDECRYQVGVVRVPENLLVEGLVKSAIAERRPRRRRSRSQVRCALRSARSPTSPLAPRA